jgi:hypothetical protein
VEWEFDKPQKTAEERQETGVKSIANLRGMLGG